MMRSFFQRAALACGVTLGLLGTAPKSANAQKALVYCPPSDAAGCTAIVNALTGPSFALGVDRAYDGTNGTVDLKAVDLFAYSVFVVPSLADNATSQPYALLRDPEVQEHLKAALIGRIAMWSGTPDQGATNRAMKDALIQNLAGWASGAYGAAKGPGLVALLDASSSAVGRYDWLRGIAPVPATSDAALLIYNSVRALNPTATAILTSGAGPIAYTNMATFGFQVPTGAAGVRLDALGQTGTTIGGQVVLLTMEAGNASGAIIRTDRDDYAPGETVTISGSGWDPNEVVKLTLHMDPAREADTELSATADASGNLTNTDFAPAAYDVGVRFVLTAMGQTSGRRAQATFTDGNKITFSTTAAGSELTTFGSVTPGQCVNGFVQERQGSNFDNAAAGGRSVTLGSAPSGATFYGQASCAGAPVTSVTISGGTNNVPFSFAIANPGTYTVTGVSSTLSGSNNASATVTVGGNVPTTTALTSSPNPSTYGNNVLFTATVTGATNPSCGSVAFKEGATTLATVTLSGSNVATLSTASLTAGSHSITAVYTPAASGCAFLTSTSAAFSHTVDTRPITVTADAKTKEYAAADPALTYQITSGSLVGTDNFTGSLSRDAGENVGGYAIKQGTLALNANYALTFVGASLTITARAIAVTADAKSKVYGAADPALTYQITSGTLKSGDTFSGALARAAGEDVGAYAITQGTLALSANYTLSFAGANLTITGRPLTVTADAQTKVYGNADPTLTYQLTTGSLVSGDTFTGSLTRAAGESVADYAIQQGTLSAGGNYTITFVGANLSITKRPVSITADPQTKVYGNADPTLTYQITTGTLAFTDAVTGTLARDAGENVGGHNITQGTLALGANYDLSFTGATLTITVRSITVTADAKAKTYGDADPALTYQITTGAVAFSDAFTGSLTRDAGNDVGSYAIKQGTLVLSSNYALTFVGANLTIGTRPITITADAKSKVYGDADPALTYQVTSGSLVDEVDLSGSLTRAPGENVGGYAIQQGSLAATANYTLTFVASTLTIEKRDITITADAKSKVYGDADPALTYQITSGNLVFGDAFSGTLARDAGEDVGSHAITVGTVSAGSNYDVTYVGANLAITRRAVTVTADAQSKTYGNADPALAYQITAGSLAFSDAFAGGLARAAGENIGTYPISQGTLALSTNYDLTYVGANLTIIKRLVTVTADATTKVYGDADPALTFQITSGSLAFSDAFAGALTRVAGENVGAYALQQGTVTLDANYTLTYVGADLTITKAPLTAKFDNVSMNFGGTVPAFTVSYTGFKFTDTPASLGGTLVFSPARATFNATTVAGVYTITPSGLTSSNYDLTFTPGTFTIVDTTKPVVSGIAATPNPVAVSTSFTVSATISDAATGGSAITSAEYSTDGGATWSGPMAGAPGGVTTTVSVPITRGLGVYNVCVRGTDAGNNTSEITPANVLSSCVLVAVYDPTTGFVTGGGWINSPTGAYAANPSLTGKANFGFVSKYKKGATAPDGSTEFQFHAAGMNFKSAVYEWLVVAGARAQFKGTGTVDGVSGFSFLLTAIDGQVNGGGNVDKFRIKIWNTTTNAVVYDNQIGTADTADPTTGLGGGSITIQAK